MTENTTILPAGTQGFHTNIGHHSKLEEFFLFDRIAEEGRGNLKATFDASLSARDANERHSLSHKEDLSRLHTRIEETRFETVRHIESLKHELVVNHAAQRELTLQLHKERLDKDLEDAKREILFLRIKNPVG